jgi:hypothetical protein
MSMIICLSYSASFPELPQMNGGKGRKGDLNVPKLYLSENMGLPVPGNLNNRGLDGNGVTIVPNVHAVMAWAVRENLTATEA